MLKSMIIKMSLSAIFLLFFSVRFVDLTIGEKITEYPLETAWKATGLPLKEVVTETWLKLNDRWLSIAELKQEAQQIKEKLLLKSKTRLTFGEQNGFNFLSFEGLQSDGTIVTVTLQSTSVDGIGETQMGLYTIHNGNIANLRLYLDTMKARIAKIGKRPHFNVLLSGERPGKISQLLVKELTGKAFQKIEATVIDFGYLNGNSFQKGYTPLIKNSVIYNNQQINVELGTRYDEARNITEIIIASPNLTDGV